MSKTSTFKQVRKPSKQDIAYYIFELRGLSNQENKTLKECISFWLKRFESAKKATKEQEDAYYNRRLRENLMNDIESD